MKVQGHLSWLTQCIASGNPPRVTGAMSAVRSDVCIQKNWGHLACRTEDSMEIWALPANL
jgi:hypothetical protein